VVSETFLKHFIPKITSRDSFSIHSYYQKEDEYQGNIGSIILLGNKSFVFNTNWDSTTTDALCCYSQTLLPLFRLLLIGGEHDAIKLCNQAVLLGWQVDVITSIKDPKTKIDFPKANTVIAQTPELIRTEGIQQHTAVILMNHNFSYDLKYLIKLQECNPIYIGVLGAAKRREKLFNHLLEFTPEVTETFLDTIHTPAGLHIGAITSEEIALSIVAEILSVVRKKEVFPLKQITGNIHSY
jgi:xanthine/CO dehydrogenase XdhC/CoxF family maturation factor